jgi:hypothetical protein
MANDALEEFGNQSFLGPSSFESDRFEVVVTFEEAPSSQLLTIICFAAFAFEFPFFNSDKASIF